MEGYAGQRTGLFVAKQYSANPVCTGNSVAGTFDCSVLGTIPKEVRSSTRTETQLRNSPTYGCLAVHYGVV